MKSTLYLSNISDLNQLFGRESSGHPLVSVVDLARTTVTVPPGTRIRADFYAVMFKNYCLNKVRYGRKYFDFQEGSLICIAPRQVISLEDEEEQKEDRLGWGVFFHPDFIHGSELGPKIRNYSFFNYDMDEALHLSDKEKAVLWEVVQRIGIELRENLDKHSKTLLISNLELLLNYCARYYDRQFLTRQPFQRDIPTKFEMELEAYFQNESAILHGLPTVKYLAGKLLLSPDYLSDLLKRETGWNAQEIIHRFIIGEAKLRLSNSGASVSEIAYGLGFEYPQYFSRLFKTKTGMTPLEFRNEN